MIIIVNGMWAEWTTWSKCSKTCGIGEHIRIRSCSNPAPRNNGEYCAGPKSEKEFCMNQNCDIDSRGKER